MKVKRENKVAQLGPTLRDPMDCSLPGSSIHGIFQARVLEFVAISFSFSLSINRLFYNIELKFIFCQLFKVLILSCIKFTGVGHFLTPVFSLLMCAQLLSHVQLFVTPCRVACQAALSMGLSWQEHWSELPFPPPSDLLTQGLNLCLLWILNWQVDSLPLSYLGSPLFTYISSQICVTLYNVLWYSMVNIYSLFFLLIIDLGIFVGDFFPNR